MKLKKSSHLSTFYQDSFIKVEAFICKPYFNRRNFTYSIKVHSPFLNWHYINDMITNVKNRENSGEILWECDYSFLTSGILPYYFHTAHNSRWVITPEFNHLENNHPDYTIFEIHTNPYNAEIYAVWD